MCQVQDAVYETQFSKTIRILAPEKKTTLQPVNRGQEQNTRVSHPTGPAYSILSFVLSRGTGASWALAVEKPAQSPGLGQGLDPREPASSRRTGDGLFFPLTSVSCEDAPWCDLRSATSPASRLRAGKLTTQETPATSQGATFLKS